ncbi:MAG: S-methyl-5-thioribose-1-phosphate isomerase [Candidatus Omnitrophota bacterium]
MEGSLFFQKGRLFYLDQRLLPLREVYRECANLQQGYRAIKTLAVRGAPLIGVFAAYTAYIAAKNFKAKNEGQFLALFDKAVGYLKSSRPTAVNLFWALDRVTAAVCGERGKGIERLKTHILKTAKMIHQEDKLLCSRMAKAGVKLVKSGDTILTHCNAGALATAGEGTALAVIYEAHRRYRNIKVYADETRPLLQGGRLTAWELARRGVDVTVICDNMAAYLLRQKKIDKIFVGADRITKSGDTANKIGTYSLAVLAKYHKVPFYVVAPFSTFDLSIFSGKDIPIEERNPDEVRKVLNKVYIAPKKIKVYNPAFDVTPYRLISAIVTDRGIIYPPFRKNIEKMMR